MKNLKGNTNIRLSESMISDICTHAMRGCEGVSLGQAFQIRDELGIKEIGMRIFCPEPIDDFQDVLARICRNAQDASAPFFGVYVAVLMDATNKEFGILKIHHTE